MSEHELYSFVIGYLKDSLSDSSRFPSTNMGNVRNGVDDKVKRSRGIEIGTHPSNSLTDQEHELINQICWDLIIQRVLTITSQGLPWITITEYGKEVVSSESPIPYDRDNYLQNIYAKASNLDTIARSYLEESLTCLHGGAYRGGAVMLGVVSEQLFIVLVKSFQENKNLSHQIVTDRYKPFSQIRDSFMRKFTPLKNELPEDLRQDLEIILEGIYLLIKNTRDDSGHPTNVVVTRDQLFSYFAIFPMYAERISKIIDFYRV